MPDRIMIDSPGISLSDSKAIPLTQKYNGIFGDMIPLVD